MTAVPTTQRAPATVQASAPARRQYDSTLRRQRAGETRARIIAAGSELLHGSSVRDWHGLTIRAVADKAGVNERTVYRHFVNEQGLRDAVMHQFEEEAGIDLRGMQLEDVADVTARIFAHVSTYPPDARQPLDPTLLDAKQRQHEALRAAVAASAGTWSEEDRTVAAAVLDVLWGVASYERMVVDWQMDPAEAIRGISWVMGLIRQAIVDQPPWSHAGSRRLLTRDGTGGTAPLTWITPPSWFRSSGQSTSRFDGASDPQVDMTVGRQMDPFGVAHVDRRGLDGFDADCSHLADPEAERRSRSRRRSLFRTAPVDAAESS